MRLPDLGAFRAASAARRSVSSLTKHAAGSAARYVLRASFRIQCFEPASRVEEERRRLSAAAEVKCDLSLQTLRDCAFELVQ